MMNVLLPALLSIIPESAAQTNNAFDPVELVRKVETQYQGETSHAKCTMTIVTESWTREYTMESWSEGRDKFLTRILAPVKDRGVATLKVGDDMWNYLPKIDRLMKIPSSLMGDGWMGSHITNDDLVKENKIDKLYDMTVLSNDGTIASIKCVPKPDAAVVWGSIIYRINIEKLIPVDVQYFDEDGELVRTMIFDDVRKISGRWIPMVMTIQPEDLPNEHTKMVYTELEFDIPLDKNMFSVNALRRR